MTVPPDPDGQPRTIQGERTAASTAYYWGEDALALDEAIDELARRLSDPTTPIETWKANAEEDDGPGDVPDTGPGTVAARRRTRLLDEVEQRVSMAPLFGGGTLVVIRQPGPLLREAGARTRLTALVARVPEGNALAFTDLTPAGASGPAASGALRDAVTEAGGDVREFRVPTRDRMESWLVRRAGSLGVNLAPGVARLLAERVGAGVREADVDRRRQTQLLNGELEKLALLRPDGAVSREDVEALVPETIPGSMWALLDAIGDRRTADAADLAVRLLGGGTPFPVIVSQLHRRLRELLIVREHLADGTRPADLVRRMRLQPYRAQKLAEQARRWTLDELGSAIDGLVELDLLSKGIRPDGPPSGISDARSALGSLAWIAGSVAPRR